MDIVDELMNFADVNRDEKLSLAEAKTLWSLLNNKNTFYMLIFTALSSSSYSAGNNYIPKIKSFCGGLIEIEQIQNYYLFSIEHDSIFPKIFPKSFKWSWPEWKYRCKITMGILEFFLEASSFNPNDEFGVNSLYLCSPIETSFGHTYTYEAKLLNYKHLFSAYELEALLADRKCKYDSDCEYSSTCVGKCDVKRSKCSVYLAKPQLVSLCQFIKVYLIEDFKNSTDNANMLALNEILDKCFSLGSRLTRSSSYLSIKSFYQANYTDHQDLNLFTDSKYAIKYSLISHDLKSLLWSFIKFTRDPVKTKQGASIDRLSTLPAQS